MSITPEKADEKNVENMNSDRFGILSPKSFAPLFISESLLKSSSVSAVFITSFMSGDFLENSIDVESVSSSTTVHRNGSVRSAFSEVTADIILYGISESMPGAKPLWLKPDDSAVLNKIKC